MYEVTLNPPSVRPLFNAWGGQAQAGEGSVRDSLSALDQAIACFEQALTHGADAELNRWPQSAKLKLMEAVRAGAGLVLTGRAVLDGTFYETAEESGSVIRNGVPWAGLPGAGEPPRAAGEPGASIGSA